MERTVSDAETAKNKSIKILSVGVTSDSDEVMLRRISSLPQKYGENYFLMDEYDDLEGLLETMADKACPKAGKYVDPLGMEGCIWVLCKVADTSLHYQR